MRGFRDKANRVADSYFKTLRWLTVVAGIAIMVMMIYITGDVTGRYLFKNPLPASFKISEMLMIFIIFWSLAYVQARGGHLRLQFLSRRFPPRGQSILNILALIIGIFIFAIITWQAADWAIKAWQTGEYAQGVWKIPYFPARLTLSVGAFIICLQFIVSLIPHISQLLGTGRVGEHGS